MHKGGQWSRANATGLKQVSGCLAFFFFISIPAILDAEPTLSGANYWGDSANAVIDGPDVSQLKQLLGGIVVSYPTIEPNNQARSKYRSRLAGLAVNTARII